MAKREKYIEQRQRFCQLALKNQGKAAEELRSLANSLDNCRNSSDVVFALKTIFCVSERTIYNDLIN